MSESTYAGIAPMNPYLNEVLTLTKPKQDYIADLAFPVMSIQNMIGATDRDDEKLRGLNRVRFWVEALQERIADSAEDGFVGPYDYRRDLDLSDMSYKELEMKEWARQVPIAQQIRRSSQEPTDDTVRATLKLANNLYLRREHMMRDLCLNSFTAINWVAITDGSGVQLGGAGAKGLFDLRRAINQYAATNLGLRPDLMILGELEANALELDLNSLGVVGDDADGPVGKTYPMSRAQLITFLEGQLGLRVLVGSAYGNSAHRGKTAVNGLVWSGIFLGHSGSSYDGQSLIGPPSSFNKGINGEGVYMDTTSLLNVRHYNDVPGLYARDDGRVNFTTLDASFNMAIVNANLGLQINSCIA